MNKRISIQELVALNNTPKANALVMKYGLRPAQDMPDLVNKLKYITMEYKEEALMDMAELHPHKDLLDFIRKESEPTSNACGCSSSADGTNPNGHGKSCQCKDCKKYSNFEYADDYLDADGSSSPKQKDMMNQFAQYMTMIAVAGIFALAITAIGKK